MRSHSPLKPLKSSHSTSSESTMSYSPVYAPDSSPSRYLHDDLLSDLGHYARDLPPSSTPTLSHGTSSSLEDRMVYTDSPASRASEGEGRKRGREEYGGYMRAYIRCLCSYLTMGKGYSASFSPAHPPRLSASGSWYLRSQSDPATYLPSWSVDRSTFVNLHPVDFEEAPMCHPSARS